jgi:hypothetical protein
MYGRSPPWRPDISILGDMDMVRCAGDGVVIGEPWMERWSPSERAWEAPFAFEAARAAAASSTVPV